MGTELSSGWEPSLESDTQRMLQESGSGLTGTRPSNGLTGPKVSLTTTTDSIAWLLWNGTRILSTSTGTTSGTTSTATGPSTTSVRRRVPSINISSNRILFSKLNFMK